MTRTDSGEWPNAPPTAKGPTPGDTLPFEWVSTVRTTATAATAAPTRVLHPRSELNISPSCLSNLPSHLASNRLRASFLARWTWRSSSFCRTRWPCERRLAAPTAGPAPGAGGLPTCAEAAWPTAFAAGPGCVRVAGAASRTGGRVRGPSRSGLRPAPRAALLGRRPCRLAGAASNSWGGVVEASHWAAISPTASPGSSDAATRLCLTCRGGGRSILRLTEAASSALAARSATSSWPDTASARGGGAPAPRPACAWRARDGQPVESTAGSRSAVACSPRPAPSWLLLSLSVANSSE